MNAHVSSTSCMNMDLGGWGCVELVALLRNGFSKASFTLFTLIWPNPGRVWSRSVDAFATFAKLPIDECNVSTSVLLTLLMLVRAVRYIVV